MASTEASLFSYDDEHKKDKSPNALRTISEAADALDVPQHVLRFWETKFSQIKPLKRNGGRRFYRPQDLEVLQQIKHLLYNQGYTIKGAKKAVDEFIHARAMGDVTSATEWIVSVPPASVNDNTPEASVVALVAQNTLIEEAVVTPIAASPSRESLLALRAELLKVRENLQAHLPTVSDAA